jgi:O-methyltransferase
MLSRLLGWPGGQRHREAQSRIATLEARLALLERRVHNRRWAAVEEMGDYLVGAQVPGDYCEFGVYQGQTFQYAARLLAPALPHMRYFGFDSFEGLPPPTGIDCVDGYSSNFNAGEFAVPLDAVTRAVAEAGADMSKVRFVKGWFNETLTDATARDLGLAKVAAAWIDCDLYESSVPVLAFIGSRLSVGSILLFDDWRVFRNLPEFGQQRAVREWLEQNPGLTLRELFSFGHHGLAFSVASVPDPQA